MSGHSHYATIKRQKAVKDAAKGNLFSKFARSIMIAAKGGADPDTNFKLRVEIDRARAASMPKENIERAIAKATSEGGMMDEVTYEGFGPKGVSVMVEAATDNKNRTAQEIKNIFERGGGSLAGPGAVSFNFESKGLILVKKSDNFDDQMLKLIDLGAEDVEESEDGVEVYVSPGNLREARKKIEEAGFEILETELQMRPKNLLSVEDSGELEKITKFLETLEEQDDVQRVYANI